jgi:hypothetical protein
VQACGLPYVLLQLRAHDGLDLRLSASPSSHKRIPSSEALSNMAAEHCSAAGTSRALQLPGIGAADCCVVLTIVFGFLSVVKLSSFVSYFYFVSDRKRTSYYCTY